MFTRQLPQKKKSCGGCVKSKRKCDLDLPRCGRCTKQGLPCEYPFAEAVVQEQQVADLSFTPSAMIAEPKLGFDFSAPPQLDLFSADTNFFAFDDSIASMPSFDPPDVVPSEAHVMSQPSYEVALLNGPHVGFSAASLNQWSASRLLFAMDIFRNAPATMVGENQTPWSHPRLYDDVMPRCLSEAYAACALSLSKSQTNANYVSRHVESRFDELMASPMPSTLSGLLAHSHSFILFLCIQVFSNDFQAHTQAHRALSKLEEYGFQLHTQLILHSALDATLLPDTLPVYPINAASMAWREYILHESARRTLLVLFFMDSLCRALRGELRHCREADAISCYLLASAHLWKACSAFDFAKLWNERDILLVQDVKIDTMMLKAQPEDVDLFGKMMMVAKYGIDEARGWFDFKGGRFED